MTLAKKIDHIAIAVKDIDAAVETFTHNFGFPVERLADLPQVSLRLASLSIGDAWIELLQPTSDTSPGAKFIAERGEGMFVLSLEVDDLDAAADALAKQGIEVSVQDVADGPRLGFISPKVTHGVLLQLIQHPKAG